MVVGKKGKKRLEQIIAEAIALIQDGGIQGLTMRKVAGVVGITEASAYRYFPDKTALLAAIIESIKSSLISPMKQILKSELTPEAKLQKVVAFHLSFVSESDGLPMVFLAEVASGNEKELVQHIREIIGAYQEILENLVSEIVGIDAKPSAKEFSTLFLGLASAVAIQRRLGIANQTQQDMPESLLPFIVNCLARAKNDMEAK